MLTAIISTLLMGSQKMGILQCAFFVKNVNAVFVSKYLEQSYQERHLAGLKALWEKRSIVAVGPFEGSENYRGVAMFDVKTPNEVKELLKDDPFIKNGVMTLEVIPWYCENRFQKGADFMEFETHWFGILERPEKAPNFDKKRLEEIQAGHMANISKMANDGLLASAGPFAAEGPRRGLFIFSEPDRKKVEAAVKLDTAIQTGRLKLVLMKWWTSKGTLPPYVKQQ